MSEPIADGVPPLPPAPSDVGSAAGADPTGAAAGDGAPVVDAMATPGTRSARRAAAEAAASPSTDRSVLDHPAVLVALSLLALVALVVGIDQASQGRVVALVPAVLLIVGYVVVVRRRRR